MQISWDRGTLVIQDIPGVENGQQLPGVVWDHRTQSHRAPAWRYAQILAAAQAHSVRDRVTNRRAKKLPSVPIPSLRPYQAAAIASWQSAGNRGIVVLPTGAGKTRTAMAAIATTRDRTLVLVPTRVLLDQWCDAFLNLGFPPDAVGRFGDGDRVEAPITVCTYASARFHIQTLGNRFSLLVVDECHHFGLEHGDPILELCTAGRRLGLTATPPEDPSRLQNLQRYIGPQVFKTTIDELSGKYLAPYDLITLQLQLDREERRAYDHANGQFQPFCRDFFRASPHATWPQFVGAAMRTRQGRDALQGWRRSREICAFSSAKQTVLTTLLQRHAGQRMLVFTKDNRAAYAVAREHLIMPITCDIARSERDEMLGWFTEGKLTALVSARVLNEGVDVPAAEIAVLVAGSQGSREYVQRIGRVLRPAEGKRASIYELIIEGTHEARQLERGRRRLVAEEPVAVPPQRR